MSYLFRRPGSQNWQLRLQPPGGKLIERSLGTPDRHAAELAAADLIKQHRAFMYQRRQARVASVAHGPWQHQYAPGLHTLPNETSAELGDPATGHVLATETTLTFIDSAGAIVSTRPNGGPAIYLTGERLKAAEEFATFDGALDGTIPPGPVRPKFIAKTASPDDVLLETYLGLKLRTPQAEKDARKIWDVFRRVIGKPLKQCTRADGRALVAFIESESPGLKSASVRRMLKPLVALVNHAIEEGRHDGVNPFAGVVTDREDSDRRLPFSDDDMERIRENLHKLTPADQLLVRVLATCGVRRGEAFEIAGEQIEGGCRFTIIGTKTAQSMRRVPFPADLLAHLPKKISGPLFSGDPGNATKRVSAWLRDECGITDPNKAPMHSFRHRAQDRLRAADCPQDIREELLGHERKTVAASYGKGSPVPKLKAWLDKIGF